MFDDDWDLNGESFVDSLERMDEEGYDYDDLFGPVSVTEWHEPIKAHQKRAAKKANAKIPTKTKDVYWIYAENKNDYTAPTDKSGKWLIFETPENIDAAWEQVRDATEHGLLGGASKVSTRMAWNGKDEYVICVYTYDWTDKKDVREIRGELRDLGFEKDLPYKTDEDTKLKKYLRTGHKNIAKYYE